MYQKTRFRILNPLETHFRPATCEEVDCQAYFGGWQTTLDESTDLGQKQAHYIRRESGRSFSEHRNSLGLTEFTFAAGQPCFRVAEHRTNIGRAPMFVVDDGEQRYRHSSADSWVDDLRTHTEAIFDEINKG